MGAQNSLSYRTSLVVIVFLALGIYNATEVFIKIFTKFRAYRGVYFWSLIAASVGIVLHAFGYFFRNFHVVESLGLEIFLVGPGGMCMITGQSIVLYSRLHLVSRNKSKEWWILAMILVDLLVIQVGATTLYAGSQTSQAARYLPIYKVWERFQVTAFFVQECILSGLYIYRTYVLMHDSTAFRGKDVSKLLKHLILVNILVIALDVTILAFQYAGLYDIQTAWKTLVYSVKLKLEFYILNRLIEITKGGLSAGRTADTQLTGSDENGTKVQATHTRISALGSQSRFGNQAYARMGDDVPLKDVSVVKTTEITVKREPDGDATSDSSVNRLTDDIQEITKAYVRKQ
ncbi:hypothetical protein K491DRAFT_598606 [Lophiostoma macrostomum CBS 122681]|uniref:DUF7703 domain-containing protein n=1 Tax=Lophiostoma macrostomum CBS 122681 TaxID=1314788 RepID=A0A6A6TAJ5_9PLEO|nr:hypothetical protein K491DRAFT_598606 [Lophiostoma macrostomum CBS 122681]